MAIKRGTENDSDTNDALNDPQEALNREHEKVVALRHQLEQDRIEIAVLRDELTVALQLLNESIQQNRQASEGAIIIQEPSNLEQSNETQEALPDWMAKLPKEERERLKKVINNLELLAKSLQGPQDVLDLGFGNARPFPIDLAQWKLPEWHPVPQDSPTGLLHRTMQNQATSEKN
ncbi:MAG TPA: hypothetical protein VIE65_13405 [Methylobacter sp.]|jgi:hypothetical protein